MSRSRVFVCSPLSPILPEGCVEDIEAVKQRLFLRNMKRAEIYCRWIADDKAKRPFAPHLFYTRFLDDFDPDARRLGMLLALEDLEECHELWAFLPEDGRPTRGMTIEIERAIKEGMIVRFSHYEEWIALMPVELR